MKYNDDWYQTGIGIIKKNNKHIKIESSKNMFIVSSKQPIKISKKDMIRLKNLDWEKVSDYKLTRKI